MARSLSIDSADEARLTVIRARTGWQVIGLAELWRYRDLFMFLVLRDIKVLYKQTVLGLGWAIIRPVFSMVVFSLVFGNLAGVPSDGVPYPLFSFAALLPWTYFATAVTASTASLVSSGHLISKIYFPRLIIPITPVIAGLLDLLVASLVMFAMMAWYGVWPTTGVLLLPLLGAIMVLTAAGVGMWLSALAVQYRDVKHAMQFVVQLLMYAAPVVWPLSLVTEKLPEWGETVRLVYAAYPMVGVIEGSRAALLGTTAIPWSVIGIGAASAVLLFVSGAFYFRRAERHFADVV